MTTTENSTNNTNNTNNAAQDFAMHVNAERARQFAAIDQKLDTAVAGVARATVAAEDARDAARASQEAAEYTARRMAPPIAPTGFVGGILGTLDAFADKALYVAKAVGVPLALAGGAFVAGKAAYGKMTTRKPAAAPPAPTAS